MAHSVGGSGTKTEILHTLGPFSITFNDYTDLVQTLMLHDRSQTFSLAHRTPFWTSLAHPGGSWSDGKYSKNTVEIKNLTLALGGDDFICSWNVTRQFVFQCVFDLLDCQIQLWIPVHPRPSNHLVHWTLIKLPSERANVERKHEAHETPEENIANIFISWIPGFVWRGSKHEGWISALPHLTWEKVRLWVFLSLEFILIFPSRK